LVPPLSNPCGSSNDTPTEILLAKPLSTDQFQQTGGRRDRYGTRVTIYIWNSRVAARWNSEKW
jgi:hypothetical protein